MTKDELIARLRSLGEQLNRDVSLTGTKEELALRVAELEEELDDTDEAAGQDSSVSPENALTGHENEVVSAQTDTVTDTAALVTVVALVTLHTDALHATRDEPVAFVLPGTAFRVSAGVADEAAGQDSSVSPENALTGHENEVVSAQTDTVTDTAALVTVVALVTLHTDALHATRDEPVAFVLPGTAFRVSAGVAAEMTERGLARMQ